MSIWDNNTYCMHWFETQNITVHDNSVGNFTSTQSFSIIFDIQPKFVKISNYTYYWEVFFWYVIFRKDYAKKEYNN